MSDHTRIEWTDATWNPIRGCTKISPGCAHCYAETFAERFRGVAGHPYEQGFDLRLVPNKLTDPLKWRTPKRVFVNSMSDLFHQDVPEAYIQEVVGVMLKAEWHTYQVLTKRSSRMRHLLETSLHRAASVAQIWWGVSVENRRDGLQRIADLRQTPAKTRFLSVEPLLEDLGSLDLTGIHWVIVVQVHAPWKKNGSSQSATSARPLVYHFSSSNGVERGREKQAVVLMGEPTTKCRPNAFVPL
jgi:protein gp37